MDVAHDTDSQTLNITAPSGKDARIFTLFDMWSVHYLQRGVDINHCDPYHDFYRLTATPNLDAPEATIEFESPTQGARPITMTMRILQTLNNDVLNVQWNYKDMGNAPKTPFEVPEAIINVNRKDLAHRNLSDFVVITNNTGPAIISIVKNGQKQYELQGFLLDEFLNYIETMAYTANQPMNGVIGAFDQ